MSMTLHVPASYPLVLVAALGGYWLNMWQMINVSKYRRIANVPYPQMYAEAKEAEADFKKKQFNCAQRAHLNTLEHASEVAMAILITGLKHPKIAVGIGMCNVVGRIIYTLGYSTGDPKKRNRGALHYFATIGSALTATWTAAQLVLESPGFLAPLL
ncbi:microsomal glutathione S-transferase 3, partial [Auriculariales sp. MPI-PUGE-AT-0066]